MSTTIIKEVSCSEHKSYHSGGSLRVKIVFETPDDPVTILNEFYHAIAISDKDAYNKYWEESVAPEIAGTDKDDCFDSPRDPGPFETGLAKRVDVLGLDKLTKEGSTYTYEEYVSNNYITRAVLVQLAEMKNKIDSGEKHVTFRSGDVLDDILRAIEIIDSLWD